MEAIGIKLNFAVLCIDCDTISRGRNNQCELCGSHALLSVAAVFDRVAVAEHKPEHAAARVGAA